MKVLFLGCRELGVKCLDFLLSYDGIIVDVIFVEDNHLLSKVKYSYNIVEEDFFSLAEKKYDLIVSVNYNKIIKAPLLSSTRLGCINIHHSHNLRIRGRHCATHAILLARTTGVWEHGTSLHYMAEGLDAGGIIATTSFSLTEEDTAYSVFNRCDIEAFSIFTNFLPKFFCGEKISRFSPTSDFFTFKRKDLPDKHIDLSLSPIEVYDLVRALTFPPYKGPYTIIKNICRELTILPSPTKECLVDAGEGRFVYG